MHYTVSLEKKLRARAFQIRIDSFDIVNNQYASFTNYNLSTMKRTHSSELNQDYTICHSYKVFSNKIMPVLKGILFATTDLEMKTVVHIDFIDFSWG